MRQIDCGTVWPDGDGEPCECHPQSANLPSSRETRLVTGQSESRFGHGQEVSNGGDVLRQERAARASMIRACGRERIGASVRSRQTSSGHRTPSAIAKRAAAMKNGSASLSRSFVTTKLEPQMSAAATRARTALRRAVGETPLAVSPRAWFPALMSLSSSISRSTKKPQANRLRLRRLARTLRRARRRNCNTPRSGGLYGIFASGRRSAR